MIPDLPSGATFGGRASTFAKAMVDKRDEKQANATGFRVVARNDRVAFSTLRFYPADPAVRPANGRSAYSALRL